MEPKNIIIRMPNWLGDLVMATPVLKDLRERFPKAKITAMALAGPAGLLEKDPYIDEILRFKRPSGWLHHVRHSELIDTLRQGDYDLGILLTNSFSSAWSFWRAGIPTRLGYAMHGRRLLLTNSLPYPKDLNQHQVVTYKKLLAPIDVPLSDSPPELYLEESEISEARHALSQMGIPKDAVIVGINPGAAYGSAKCWLPERFHSVAHQLIHDKGYYVLFFGDDATSPLVSDVCNGLKERYINLAGKTNLRQLMAYISLCRVLLTNDSGPMHMAAALGVRPLALFGSTSDTKTPPYNNGKVIHKHVECSPCYLRTCPIDFRCMKRISSDEVYDAMIKMVEK